MIHTGLKSKQDDAAEKLLSQAYWESFNRLNKLWQQGKDKTHRRWGVCGNRDALQAAIRDMNHVAQEIEAVLARM